MNIHGGKGSVTSVIAYIVICVRIKNADEVIIKIGVDGL